MADKPKLNVFTRTEAPAPTGAPADLSDLDSPEAHIRQSGVGLKTTEIAALDAIGAELGIARNALLRYAARRLIQDYRAGRLDLASDVIEPPPQKVRPNRLRMPGSKK